MPPTGKKDAAKGKKKKKKQDAVKANKLKSDPESDLSPEDLALKQKLELHVKNAQDSKQRVQRVALEAMRQEIRTATSSMTSVPNPLEFLRPHYKVLKAQYEKMPESDLKRFVADIISVLTPTMPEVEGGESLRFRLQGTVGDIGSWGPEYVRNLAGEIGKNLKQRQVSVVEQRHI